VESRMLVAVCVVVDFEESDWRQERGDREN
jgi:hypothetical protein